MSTLGAMYGLCGYGCPAAGQPSVSTRMSVRHASIHGSSKVATGRYWNQWLYSASRGGRVCQSVTHYSSGTLCSKFDKNGYGLKSASGGGIFANRASLLGNPSGSGTVGIST
jgi:hypothetical protein